MRTVLPAIVVAAAACGDASPAGFTSGASITTASLSSSSGTSSSTGADSTSSSTDDSAGGSGSASTGTVSDVGVVPDFPSGQPPGCKGKVDILFMISSFFTMQVEQKQLLASFPGFVETLEEKLTGFDLHIMAPNPTGGWTGDSCESPPKGCAEDYPNCGETAEDYECGIFPSLTTKCDRELGAGLVFNAGYSAANRICDLYGGNRYIISGEPNLPDAFECIAKVGNGGGDPPMGDALIAALSSKLNGEGGCNQGFLREDALLFIVVINDTEDIKSTSWPYQQYDAIIAAKKDPNAVIMLAVTGQVLKEGEPEIPGCTYDDGVHENQKVLQLLNKFPYKVEGDTCAKSYAPYFSEAADKIAEACGSFVPQ